MKIRHPIPLHAQHNVDQTVCINGLVQTIHQVMNDYNLQVLVEYIKEVIHARRKTGMAIYLHQPWIS